MIRSRGRTALLALVAVLALGAVTCAPALASGKPFVETKPATNVGESVATLNGVVNPNGAETKYHFEYGTTTKYGMSTPELAAGSGTSNVQESKMLEALTANATYHYRIVASNVNGTADGADQVFTTLAPALPAFSKSIRGSAAQPTKVLFSGQLTFMGGQWDVSCSRSGEGTGWITGAKSGTATLVFHECTYGTGRCTSPGAAEGTIVSEPLPFSLVYITKEPTKQVALAFNHKGGTFLTFVCGGVLHAALRHTILAPITPINTLAKAFTATLSGEKGYQAPRENFTEDLTGKELSVPEMQFSGPEWTQKIVVSSTITVEPTEKAGQKVKEGMIEA